MRHTLIWTITIGWIFGLPLVANIVEPDPIVLRQPSGQEFGAIPRGSEFGHWLETLDGYTIVRDGNFWVYATLSSDLRLKATDIPVGALAKRDKAGIHKHLHPPIQVDHNDLALRRTIQKAVNLSQRKLTRQ